MKIARRTLLSRLRSVSDVLQSTKWIIYLCVFSILAVLGIVFEYDVIGQIVIVIYGCIGLFFGVKSSEVFSMALVAFGVIIISTIFNIDVLAKHFATYAFLLLTIGVLYAIKEQWHSSDSLSDVTTLKHNYLSGAYSRSYSALPNKKVFIDRRLR